MDYLNKIQIKSLLFFSVNSNSSLSPIRSKSKKTQKMSLPENIPNTSVFGFNVFGSRRNKVVTEKIDSFEETGDGASPIFRPEFFSPSF